MSGHPKSNAFRTSLFRTFVFGVEDGLVSTVGLVSGIAAGGVEQGTVVLTGIVLVLVEGFSMAVGSLLSESSAVEYEKHREARLLSAVLEAVVMFFSYVTAGLLLVAPYVALGPAAAFRWSIGLALAALFCLGLVSARASRLKRPLHKALVMTVVGGTAIILGVLVGRALGA